jgi:Lrp/AsnC family leucine-responsive transcriptional regulator
MNARPRHLDRIDRKILKSLYGNARITNQDLAERVGLSPAPCWKRLRTLEEQGFILGYTARLNAKALGFGETVVIHVTLAQHSGQALEEFERALGAIPEVVEAYLITGDYDYLLRVAVSSADHYETFFRKLLQRVPAIRQCRSSFVLRCLKQGSDLIEEPAT